MQVGRERATLEEARASRVREREQFLGECLEEKRQLAVERAELGRARENATTEEVRGELTLDSLGFTLNSPGFTLDSL
eukprot:834750-Prorocentrum_minimum.AAC.1